MSIINQVRQQSEEIVEQGGPRSTKPKRQQEVTKSGNPYIDKRKQIEYPEK